MTNAGPANGRRILDDYDVKSPVIRRANPRMGLPSIRGAVHRDTGESVILKTWPRREGVADRELDDIWRNELRQLHRLMSYPKARDRLAVLRDSADLENGFHLLLESDNREPLEARLARATKSDWFFSRDDQSRLRLWREIGRLAEGLDILHSQGLLHRNIDAWSVLTSAGDEPDFILTGFEWSVRLTSGIATRRRRGGSGFQTVKYSFYEDWKAIGILAARLLGFRSNARQDQPYFPDVAQHADSLLASERYLLVLLLGADPLARLDAKIVLDRLSKIEGELRDRLTGREPRLVLAIGIGPKSRLSSSIYMRTEGEIDSDDRDGQIAYVVRDLSEGPRLVRFKSRDGIDAARYVLRGRHLNYRLRQFAPPNGAATWSVARCSEVDEQEPAHAQIDVELRLDSFRIEVVTNGKAAATYQQYVGRTTKWDGLFVGSQGDQIAEALSDRTYGALTLLQVLDSLLQAAEIWPVAIVHSRSAASGTQLRLTSRPDPVMDRLSDALGLRRPAVRLSALFNSDNPVVDGEWRLYDQPVLGHGGDRSGQWRVVDTRREGSKEVYILEGTGVPPQIKDAYLRSGGSGNDQLLRRRLKALKALREHGELLEMLSSALPARKPSHEVWSVEDEPKDLDASKVAAMREMWSVLPLYLLQGPPGVGKTKLVEELISKRMAADGGERFLLTAQSHAAVDHLVEKVEHALSKGRTGEESDPVLALRCRRIGHPSGSGPWDLPVRALEMAKRLSISPIVEAAPRRLRERVTALVLALDRAASDDPEDVGDEPLARNTDRSFASLLLRSSNLVFASTNARELETLLEERAQFDWSIVEEAGKATGTDLLAPLLLSHRRLMIGDHKQLPPFGAEQITDLLATPEKIVKALDAGRHLLARPFGIAGIEDALDFVSNAPMDELVSKARTLFLMFESMVVAELASPPRQGRLSRFHRLGEQHRMHPAIGLLISEAFYDGKLRTSSDAEARFQAAPPFTFEAGSKLPECPIVFVTIPHAHATPGQRSPESSPRYRNIVEANLCVDVLAKLEAVGGARPSIAVLTPYRSQMNELQKSVAEARMQGRLRNLEAFHEVAGSLCHTVDSFQGNEADVVIISLVRNNAHTGEKALGFLSDSRRMNVLMSRAKWRMVLVGSEEFLRARFHADLPPPEVDKLKFLRRWLETFDRLSEGTERTAASVRADDVKGVVP